MRLSDLVRDDVTGLMSHSKCAAIVAFLAATVAFLRICWTATAGEGVAWLFLVYLGTAGGFQSASKLMGLKWGGSASSSTTTTESSVAQTTTVVAPPAARGG